MSHQPKAGNGNMPNLQSYLGKQVMVRLQCGRRVSGELKGYDAHMNLVLGEAWEEVGRPEASEKKAALSETFIRGSMVINIEQLSG